MTGSRKVSRSSRYYEGESDLREMHQLLMEARACTDDWRYAHVGELQFAFFMVLCHLDPHGHIRLWHDADRKLIGYSILGEDPSLDWQVAPGHEWTGIESEAIAWAEDRLAALRAREPGRWGGGTVSGARQDNAQRIAFLGQHRFGYRGDFSEVNLLRSLEDAIPAAAAPEGFTVRGLSADREIPARAAAQREVWTPWTVGNVSDDDYLKLTRLPGYHQDLDVVAVTADGVVAAYVNGWIDEVNAIGDFGPVGALPAYRRLGLTRAVLVEALHRMRDHGMNRVCVSTTEGNAAARRLYESLGFTVMNRYLDYVQDWRAHAGG